MMQKSIYFIQDTCRTLWENLPEVFIQVVNLSITVSWLILAVLLFRFLLKRAPKWINCALWGLVVIRLLIPFSLESIFSLVPSAETFEPEFIHSRKFTINSGISGLDNRVNEYMGDRYYEGVTVPADFKWDVTNVLAATWLIGMVLLFGYAVCSYLKLKRDMRTATLLKDNVFQSEKVGSPFVLGLFRPVIYLPYTINDEDIAYVIAHENAHIARKDHWIKPIGYMLLMVHWFNPLLWVAYVLLCRDIELACDEKVIRRLGVEERQDYSLALLNCSMKRFRIAACPLAFGEVSVKERIKSVMHYKKPAFWMTLVGVICCAVAAVCFLTNPKEKLLHAPEPFCHSYRVKNIVYDAPQYSFTYTTDSAPLFSFSADYMMMAKYVLIENGEWFQIPGGFKEVKLTKNNFDTYFKGITSSDGPTSIWGAEGIDEIRKGNKKAWCLKVSENLEDMLAAEHVFYYLLLQDDGKVYLTLGYDDEQNEPHIRWLFELERIDLVDAKVYTEGITTTLGTTWYPAGKFEFDYEALAEAVVYDIGTIELEVDFDCDSLIVGEDYYEYTRNSAKVHRNIYELTPNASGKFKLDVSRKGNVRDEQAVYYVETPNGKSVFRVNFPLNVESKNDISEGSKKETNKDITLKEAINAIIIEHNKEKYINREGLIYCASHAKLGTMIVDASRMVDGKEVPYSDVIIYALTRYQVYSSYDGELTEVGGGSVPAVITLEQGQDGAFTLKEYREPRDGAYYKTDVEELFPAHILTEVYNAQAYVEELDEACLKQAEEYIKMHGSLDTKINEALEKLTVLEIEKLLEELTALPLHASMPWEYAQILKDEYEQLIEYDKFTLQYCFEEFLKGGQTDLRGHIMAQACQEIVANWALSEDMPGTGEYATGQDWFDAFLKNAHELEEQYKDEQDTLEKYYPATWLLLQIEGE